MKVLPLCLPLVCLLACSRPHSGSLPPHIEISPIPAEPTETLLATDAAAGAVRHRLCFFTVARNGYDALTVTENTALDNGHYGLAPSLVATLLKSDTSRILSVEAPLLSAAHDISVRAERPYKGFLLVRYAERESPYLYRNTYLFTADSAGYRKEIVLEVVSGETVEGYRFGS